MQRSSRLFCIATILTSLHGSLFVFQARIFRYGTTTAGNSIVFILKVWWSDWLLWRGIIEHISGVWCWVFSSKILLGWRCLTVCWRKLLAVLHRSGVFPSEVDYITPLEALLIHGCVIWSFIPFTCCFAAICPPSIPAPAKHHWFLRTSYQGLCSQWSR